MTNQAWVPEVGESCEISNMGNEYEWCEPLWIGETMCVVNHKTYKEQHYHLRSVKFRPLPANEDKAVENCMQCHGSGTAQWQSGDATQSVTCPLCLGTGVSVDYFIDQLTAKVEAGYRKQEEVKSMAAAFEFAALICASYSDGHTNADQAKGARSVGGVMLAKADGLRNGCIKPNEIYDRPKFMYRGKQR